MDRGVSGFRFDALKFLYENDTFADEPYVDGKENSLKYQDFYHIYILDQPENYDIIIEWRHFLDKYSERKNTYPRYSFNICLVFTIYVVYSIIIMLYILELWPRNHIQILVH